jgi:5-methylcytosine-specific restriction endonuclease McrA
MARNGNTNTAGRNFDEATVRAVWQKGRAVPGYDPNIYRKDVCGAWMQRTEYGTTGTYGWEIDHIKPVSKGGSDDLSNLQPLQWQNNRHKSDDWPQYTCAVAA